MWRCAGGESATCLLSVALGLVEVVPSFGGCERLVGDLGMAGKVARGLGPRECVGRFGTIFGRPVGERGGARTRGVGEVGGTREGAGSRQQERRKAASQAKLADHVPSLFSSLSPRASQIPPLGPETTPQQTVDTALSCTPARICALVGAVGLGDPCSAATVAGDVECQSGYCFGEEGRTVCTDTGQVEGLAVGGHCFVASNASAEAGNCGKVSSGEARARG